MATTTATENRKLELRIHDKIYDVTEFIKRHPGGSMIKSQISPPDKPVYDATDCFERIHPRTDSPQDMSPLKMLATIPSRPYDATNDDPKQVYMKEDFRNFTNQLKKDGYFDPSVPHILYRHIELISFFVLGGYLVTLNNTWLYCLGILILGFSQGRAGWLQHEANHNSLTGIWSLDKVIGSFWFSVGESGSAGWWRRSHNRHHASAQHKSWDADLETLPFLAYDTFTARDAHPFVLKIQAYVYPIITWVVINFWKFFLHPLEIVKRKLYMDGFFLAVHWVGWFVIFVPYMGWGWALWTHFWMGCVQGTYLFVNFALNHTHLPALAPNDRENWIEKAYIRSVDIYGFFSECKEGESNWFTDFFEGYLNYQTQHHLWPTLPQFKSSQLRKQVREFAERHGLVYQQMTWLQAFKATFNNLATMGEQLKKIKQAELALAN